MANVFTIEPSRSYKTAANAIMAVEKCEYVSSLSLRYFVMEYLGVDPKYKGRFFPVFIGSSAMELGVHQFFNVIG